MLWRKGCTQRESTDQREPFITQKNLEILNNIYTTTDTWIFNESLDINHTRKIPPLVSNMPTMSVVYKEEAIHVIPVQSYIFRLVAIIKVSEIQHKLSNNTHRTTVVSPYPATCRRFSGACWGTPRPWWGRKKKTVNIGDEFIELVHY